MNKPDPYSLRLRQSYQNSRTDSEKIEQRSVDMNRGGERGMWLIARVIA